jgi:methyl-accepting chemotaxis protein
VSVRPENESRKTEEALSQLVGHVFGTLIADVVRARRLLSDAVPQLTSSFLGLRDGLEAQTRELTLVSEAMRGAGGKEGFLGQIRSVLDVFVNDLVKVSHSSMQLVTHVESLGVEVDTIVSHVTQLETLAKTTKLVALNARIEAHRAGDSGRTFRVVADEVKMLANDSAEFSQQIREVVLRAHAGLAEAKGAATSLASHDLNSILNVHTEVLTTISRLDTTNSRMSEALQTFHQNVNEAIHALQFEDILNQLLCSIGDRLGHLQELWSSWLLARTGGEPKSWAELDAMIARVEPKLASPSDVHQTTMTLGTSELF